MYRLVIHLVRDPPTAEDVTQEAFIKAYRSLRRFRWQSKFSTWLFRIARNCAVDAIRHRERARRLIREVSEPSPAPDSSLRAALSDAIESLPRELREAFVLIEVFGFSYGETADVLSVPAGTLKSRMHRARGLLVDALEERDADEV